MSILRWFGWFAAVIVLLGFHDKASARFLFTDADELDDDSKLGSEYYNDLLSYRYPQVWQRLWQKTKVGMRINAGSFNTTKLMVTDDLIMDMDPTAPVAIAYQQSRFDSLDESQRDREVRLSYGSPTQRLMLLADDGGVRKEFADLGIGWAVLKDGVERMRVYFWSVDHYYNEKVDTKGNKYTRSPYAVGTRGSQKLINQFEISWNLEWEHPLRWRRHSQDSIYERQRHTTQLRLSRDLDSPVASQLYASLENTSKTESFESFQNRGSQAPKSKMERDVTGLEMGILNTEGERERSLGVLLLERQYQRYDRQEAQDIPASQLQQKHQEFAVFATDYAEFNRHAALCDIKGLQVNFVRIRQNQDFRSLTEIKFQWGLDWKIGEASRIMINTTWDIDELYRNAPYTSRPFTPWGGGNVQFLMQM